MLENYFEDYSNFINDVNNDKKSSSKNILIIIKNDNLNNNSEEIIIQELNEKFFKIKDYLARCGNNSYELDKKETIDILFYFFNNKIRSE